MKLKYLSWILILLLTTRNKTQPNEKAQYYYIGIYTKAESKGIYRVELCKEGRFENIKLMAKTENPSFLVCTKDHKFLVAVCE
tara:strand:+ start:369 stop:617 length:249 start_codon:yes stop_codon:yes gene_type:complete